MTMNEKGEVEVGCELWLLSYISLNHLSSGSLAMEAYFHKGRVRASYRTNP